MMMMMLMILIMHRFWSLSALFYVLSSYQSSDFVQKEVSSANNFHTQDFLLVLYSLIFD